MSKCTNCGHGKTDVSCFCSCHGKEGVGSTRIYPGKNHHCKCIACVSLSKFVARIMEALAADTDGVAIVSKDEDGLIEISTADEMVERINEKLEQDVLLKSVDKATRDAD